MTTAANAPAPVEATTPGAPSYLIPFERLPEHHKKLQVTSVIRTNKGCFGLKTSPIWGSRLIQVDEPEPLPAAEITQDQVDSLELPENFTKIPADLWQRVVQLYLYFCDPNNKTVDQTTEVSVRFTKKRDDPTSWRCWVPRQEVGGASVHARFDNGMVDIATGEVIEGAGWPLEDEYDAGSSHSHNTMGTFFSGVDDTNEKPCPGIHIVVGNISITSRQYVVLASIVLDKKRFLVDADSVMDTTKLDGVTFHPKVLEFVKRHTSGGSSGRSSFSDAFDNAKRHVVIYDKNGKREALADDDPRVKQLLGKNPTGETGIVLSGTPVVAPKVVGGASGSDRRQSTIEGRRGPDMDQVRLATRRLGILLDFLLSTPEGKKSASEMCRNKFGFDKPSIKADEAKTVSPTSSK